MSSNGTEAPAETQAAVEGADVQVRGLSFREPGALSSVAACWGQKGLARGDVRRSPSLLPFLFLLFVYDSLDM